MLALVVADRDLVGVVEEDVGGHQHRVVEEADRHRLLTLRDFSLNCVMRCSSPKVAVQLRSQVSSAWARTWLCTNSRQRSRVEAGREQQRGQAPGRGA